jgi:hypothetical protein
VEKEEDEEEEGNRGRKTKMKRTQKGRIRKGRKKEWKRTRGKEGRRQGGTGKRRIPFHQCDIFSIADCTASNDGKSNLREFEGKRPWPTEVRWDALRMKGLRYTNYVTTEPLLHGRQNEGAVLRNPRTRASWRLSHARVSVVTAVTGGGGVEHCKAGPDLSIVDYVTTLPVYRLYIVGR